MMPSLLSSTYPGEISIEKLGFWVRVARVQQPKGELAVAGAKGGRLGGVGSAGPRACMTDHRKVSMGSKWWC